MQGKQYCIGETRKIGGTVFIGFEERDPTSPEGQSASEALDDYGCRHYITPIICGISEPRWTKDQIEQSKRDHAKEYEIDGVKGNKYFWTQEMRKLETQIRYAKDEIEALRALGGNQATISKYKAKITRYLAEYDEITTATGIDGDVEWKRRMVKFARSGSGASGGTSGARNPYGDKAQEHADKYYDLVRSMKTDVSKIAKSTGFSESKIQEVKDFIFNEKHDLGGVEKEHFKPDYMMSESWKRLIDGKPELHDITLINHELMERDLMQKGFTQAEAHILASKSYNYAKEAAEFYDKIKKYKDYRECYRM